MVTLKLPPCSLGEGPLWHRETNEFVFTDITAGILYAWNPETEICRTLLSCNYQIGAFLFDKSGDLILFTDNGVFSCSYNTPSEDWRLLFKVPMISGERFNDAICDPKGRMIAGTKTDTNTDGNLYLFEAGKEPRLLISNLMISNGMGFSSDGTTFFHIDSGRRSIYQYHYNLEKGIITHPEDKAAFFNPVHGPFGKCIWLETHEDQAVPDGMTVDAEGKLWVAFWGRGCIGRIDPVQKKLLEVIKFPASQISSLTFGGRDLNQLLITSASTGTTGIFDGQIYSIQSNYFGREEHRFLSV